MALSKNVLSSVLSASVDSEFSSITPSSPLTPYEYIKATFKLLFLSANCFLN